MDTQQINTEMFIKSIRKYRDIRKFTPQSVSDSIDKIVVGKRQNIDSVIGSAICYLLSFRLSDITDNKKSAFPKSSAVS